jgi:Golgi phosphoprotein 3
MNAGQSIKARVGKGRKERMLTLFEELYLLALNEEKGNFIQSTREMLPFAFSGALLDELALRKKIILNSKSRIEVADNSPTGEEVLDKALREIQAVDKTKKPVYWVSHFTEPQKKTRERLGERLASRGILSQEDNRFYRISSGEQAVPSKYEMKQTLRSLIFMNGADESRALALLTLLNATGLLHLVFTPDELDFVQKEIHMRVLRGALEDPALQIVEEIEQAVRISMEDASD